MFTPGLKINEHEFIWLVVSNMFYFPFHIWDVILPIDELIFFKMVIAPPTFMITKKREPFLPSLPG